MAGFMKVQADRELGHLPVTALLLVPSCDTRHGDIQKMAYVLIESCQFCLIPVHFGTTRKGLSPRDALCI